MIEFTDFNQPETKRTIVPGLVFGGILSKARPLAPISKSGPDSLVSGGGWKPNSKE